MRVQLSHWMMLSLRRAWLKICGRRRTWQTCTETFARFSHGLSLATVGDALEDRQRFGAHLRGQDGPLFGRALKVGSGRDALGVERLPVARDLGLLGFQRGFRHLAPAASVSASSMRSSMCVS